MDQLPPRCDRFRRACRAAIFSVASATSVMWMNRAGLTRRQAELLGAVWRYDRARDDAVELSVRKTLAARVNRPETVVGKES
jgi:hypothetical protein